MTAYGAAVSLKNTIDYILHSSHFTLVGHSLQIIQLAKKELLPLQVILQRLDSTRKSMSRKKVNALDGRIKEALLKFEDLLESIVTDQILSQQLENDVSLFSIDLQRLHGDVGSFIQTVNHMEKEYIYEYQNMGEDDEEDASISSTVGLGATKSKMIGLSDQVEQLKEEVIRIYGGKHKLGFHIVGIGLIGMAGVGKTTLANQIFEDPQIQRRFKCRAWVTVGRKPELTQLFRYMIAQLCGTTQEFSYLKGKDCLIVLDDVWESDLFNSLISFLPAITKGLIQILVTTREQRAIYENVTSDSIFAHCMVVRLLNEEESKDLLCHRVFGDEMCPPQLDKAAIKIAKKCEGLPLTIVTVAGLVSKSHERDDPNYWDEVAEERNSVFTDAYNEISKVLFPSYDYLPQCLKMPFLFMGVFPLDYDIPISKIINMLTTGGWFLHRKENKSFEVYVRKCLFELCIHRTLVLFNKKSTFWHDKLHGRGMFKTCRLHSSWWYLCRREAKKNKFYHVLNKLVDASEVDVRGHRCLCLQNNMLFGIKEFCNSVRLNCASFARSLLFYGPYHQYPIPIDVGFRLLREIDALTQRFYTFPIEILILVQLRYLALTCNGELPTTISKLFNLRVLIVHPHMSIRCCRAPSYVPIQIWEMQELEHIEILGKSLRAPNHVASLEKLLTLVGVNANIGTILELSRRIPNIRKLGVQIELTPHDNRNDLLSCFGCISTVESLETLKFSVINPVIQCANVVPATPNSLMLPRRLKKLHLSGMGFAWEYMDVVGSLPYLQVLKVRSYSFRGSKWETQTKSFLRLEYRLIEDSGLVQWKPGRGSFPQLRYLSMKHCYKLEDISWPSRFLIGKIELVNCNPVALTCAKQLKPSQYSFLVVTIFSSFDKKPITMTLERTYTSDQDTDEEYEDDDEDDLANWEDTNDKDEDDDEDLGDWIVDEEDLVNLEKDDKGEMSEGVKMLLKII